MNILVTGGYGFIGLNIIPLLLKEGHKVIVIDIKSQNKKILKPHYEYILDAKDDHCEEVFASHSIDAVIHLAEMHDYELHSRKIVTSNMIGLTKILSLCTQYEISKFIYLSSLDVYGESDGIITEKTLCHPTSTYGKWKLAQEETIIRWQQDYDLNAKILRMGQVYGPHQDQRTFQKIASRIGFVDDEYLFVKDLIYAINSLLTYSKSSIYNVVMIPDENEFNISTDLIKKELYWKPKKSFRESIQESEVWFNEHELMIKSKKKKSFITKLLAIKQLSRVLPYLENIVTFVVFIYLYNLLDQRGVETQVDLLLVYIIVMGVVYGLKQSTLATVLSILFYINSVKSAGETFLSATYNVSSLLHISVYIFVGSIIGYLSDTKRLEIDEKKQELSEVKEKLSFTYEMYDESKKERTRLHDQILSSNDSFGKIYSIIQTLEALEPEKIYYSAIDVIEEILEVNEVVIYFMTKNQYYLRLIAQSKNLKIPVQKSIHVSDQAALSTVVENKNIFLNKSMDATLPKIIIPIGNDETIFAVIYIHDVTFEDFTAYKVNLIKVVASLITNSIQRAYQYLEATEDNKFIENTSIMKTGYFRSIVMDKMDPEKLLEVPSALISIHMDETTKSLSELNDYLYQSIREFDTMGMSDAGELYVLLTQTTNAEALFVINRFKSNFVNCEIVKEEDIHGIFNHSSIH